MMPVEGSSKNSVVFEVEKGGEEEDEEGGGVDGGKLSPLELELGMERVGWFQTNAPAATDAARGKSTAATKALSCVAWQAASKHMPAGDARAVKEVGEVEVKEVEEVEEGDAIVAFRREFCRLAGRDESPTRLFETALIVAIDCKLIEAPGSKDRAASPRCLFRFRFFSFLIFQFTIFSGKKNGKKTRVVFFLLMADDEEAAAAGATLAAASPSRPTLALRGFIERLVDECRVEVRRER